ncbi:Small RNA 2'-O-methyltransferase, partial [Spheniscus demersus]
MDKNFQEEQFTGIIKFTPPLYKQRYQFIKDLVGKYKPKKVADLGCADCTLLWMLKFCNCIEVLAGLDICASVMKEKMHRLSPLPGDYLQPAERSLTVTLHHGSVAHKDPCMLGFDLVTCIELIEHLEQSELKKFPEVVFGFMAPSIVVISTPNSEFNPLLPGVTLFRHPDHKFEWNRAQFQSWALETARRYDYSVEFTGVGHPLTGMEKVGFCTQIGVFVRKYPQTTESAQSEKPTEAVYKTV